jgi:uncharacterized membrane protein YdbT with pleckstrin-like domain
MTGRQGVERTRASTREASHAPASPGDTLGQGIMHCVALSQKHLGPDEHVVLSLRTHVKALLLPALTLIVTAGVVGYLAAWADGRDYATPLRWVLAVLAIVIIVWRVLIPFVHWLSTTYTVTNRRLITRTGILTRRGHDIPLPRISTVSSERGVLDRLLGCGTLLLSEASDSQVRLHDVPRVESVALTIANLLHGGVEREQDDPQLRRLDDGT